MSSGEQVHVNMPSGEPQDAFKLMSKVYGEDVATALQDRWEAKGRQNYNKDKFDYFFQLGESSPQFPPCATHRDNLPEHVLEFLAKLVLYAPEQWFTIVTGLPRPESAKNNLSAIGVAYDASSRLRRAGIEFYHAELTKQMRDAHAYADGEDMAIYVDSTGKPRQCRQSELPPRQEDKVRVVAISDTHLLHDKLGKLPQGDVLVHSGDLSYEESRSEDAVKFDESGSSKCGRSREVCLSWATVVNFFRFGYMGAPDPRERIRGLDVSCALGWLSKVGKDFKHTVLVGGNHDYILQQLGEDAGAVCSSYDIHYLHTRAHPIELDGLGGNRVVRVWGSAVSTAGDVGGGRAIKSGNCAFQEKAADEPKFNEMTSHLQPGSVDIMVTHGPPNGILLGTSKGSKTYEKAVNELISSVRPALYVCGHAHNGADIMKQRAVLIENDIVGINACCVGTWNQLHGLPIVVDIAAKKKQVDGE